MTPSEHPGRDASQEQRDDPPRWAGPPRWSERLLTAALPWQYRDEQLGDLSEGFRRRARSDERAARRWYRSQVVRSLPSAIRLRFQLSRDAESSPGSSMDSILQDVRFAFRSLVKSPGFAVVATTTLALAIGVNTAIFSIVNSIVFADLPMDDSEEVALVRGVNAELGIEQGSVTAADFLDLRERARSFTALAALTEGRWVLTGRGSPERVQGLRMTANTPSTWQLPAAAGRAFVEGEDDPGAPRVAMLTHGYWEDRFGGRADVVGETLVLDGLEHTVVGVAHPRLEFASFIDAEVIVPLALERTGAGRTDRNLFVSGRLAPGVTHEMAGEEVQRISRDLVNERPEVNRGWSLSSGPVRETMINDDGKTILLLLQLTVGMVILIACANIANMLLARATARGREFAVRAALGAARRRMIRQLLTESLIVSILSAAAGLAIAAGLNRLLFAISAGREVVFAMAKLDGRVLGFTLLVSLVAPLLFGLVPALRASGVGASAALRERGSDDGGRSGRRMRAVLVSTQVALALSLMVVASILTQAVWYMSSRPLGFDPADLVTVRLDLPVNTYEEPDDVRSFFEQAIEEVATIPAMHSVSIVDALPGVDFASLRSVEIEGYEQPADRAAPSVRVSVVGRGYFDALGLEVQRGRSFSSVDGPESGPVAVVSRRVADRYWPDEGAVGRRFRTAGEERWVEVVGVVSDVRSSTEVEESALAVYVPHAQEPGRGMYVVGRTTAELSRAAPGLREAVWAVDPDQPVGTIRTMERAQYERYAPNYALLSLFVIFAVFALVMASVGIYGVMSYTVSQRRGEIGLRMALGAEVATVRWMVVSQGIRLLAVGIAVGLGAAFLLTRLLASLVVGVSPTDPATFVGVPVVLATVALLANMLPARRATRTDPATSLRAE